MFQWGGHSKGGFHGDVTQQVGILFTLLQLIRGIIQHLFVTVTHLLHFQPVDLPPQAYQLTRKAVILHLHLSLWTRVKERENEERKFF